MSRDNAAGDQNMTTIHEKNELMRKAIRSANGFIRKEYCDCPELKGETLYNESGVWVREIGYGEDGGSKYYFRFKPTSDNLSAAMRTFTGDPNENVEYRNLVQICFFPADRMMKLHRVIDSVECDIEDD